LRSCHFHRKKKHADFRQSTWSPQANVCRLVHSITPDWGDDDGGGGITLRDVIEEVEHKNLDQELYLTADSRITFIRLTLLSGG
jgi:hypothetical protein